MKTVLERFHDKYVKASNGCWVWTAARTSDGYGNFQWEGRVRQAQRVSWKIHFGFMPESQIYVCHKCDNPACVNPDHLFLGTQLENMEDCAKKGRARKRGRKGEDHAQSKLSQDQVMKILKDPRMGTEIAKEYGCSPSLVCMLRRGQRWKHLKAQESL